MVNNGGRGGEETCSLLPGNEKLRVISLDQDGDGHLPYPVISEWWKALLHSSLSVKVSADKEQDDCKQDERRDDPFENKGRLSPSQR